MKVFFMELVKGFCLVTGVVLALYIFGITFNAVERFMLSQNCERYFETLKEQNLVPHRCYTLEESKEK